MAKKYGTAIYVTGITIQQVREIGKQLNLSGRDVLERAIENMYLTTVEEREKGKIIGNHTFRRVDKAGGWWICRVCGLHRHFHYEDTLPLDRCDIVVSGGKK